MGFSNGRCVSSSSGSLSRPIGTLLSSDALVLPETDCSQSNNDQSSDYTCPYALATLATCQTHKPLLLTLRRSILRLWCVVFLCVRGLCRRDVSLLILLIPSFFLL